MRSRGPRGEGGLLAVRVQPRARRDEVVGWRDGVLRLRVTAAPADGRANRAALALLAEALGVPVSTLELVAGAASRDKRVRVGGLGADQVRARLGGTGA